MTPEHPYRSCAEWFRERFGTRVQKLSVDAGFTCPNRDGTAGRDGCSFCLNGAFTPSYCTPQKPIAQQLAEGIGFHRRRYRRATRYLAYFQAYSNTYAPLEVLRARYEEALAVPGVAGLVIATRPDCVDGAKLDYLARLAERCFVSVEYGVESTSDATLAAIGRGHDFATARRAIEATAARGLHTGAHFILGLPGEEDDFLIAQTETINALPIDTVKFHQLQLFRGTRLAAEYDADPSRFRFRTLDAYLDLVVEIMRRLRPDIVVERFAAEAPPRYHHTAAAGWGLIRNETLWQLLGKRFRERGSYQGEFFVPLSPGCPAANPPAEPDAL